MEKVKYRALTINNENLQAMIDAHIKGLDFIVELDAELRRSGYDLVKLDNIEISSDIEPTEINLFFLDLLLTEFKKRKNLAILNPKYSKITEPWEVIDIDDDNIIHKYL